MLIKIERLNTFGETKECLVNTDYIVGITEKHTNPQNLYDEDGNIVETRETPKVFEIVLRDGTHTFITEDIYTKLLAKLQVETLD